MILSCPACTASFEVPDASLGPRGRKVRCSACGNVWRAGAPEEAAAAAPAVAPTASAPPTEPQPAAATEDALGLAAGEPAAPVELPGQVEPPGQEQGEAPPPFLSELEEFRPRRPVRSPPPLEEKPRRRAGLLIGWILLVLLAIGLPALAWVERKRVVDAMPEAAALYALFDVEVEAPLTRLALQDVTLVRRTIDSRRLLIVEGLAVNRGTQAVELPPLRARLLNEEGTVVQSWTFLAQRTRLEPNEAAPFRTETDNVPDEASINIEFVPIGSD